MGGGKVILFVNYLWNLTTLPQLFRTKGASYRSTSCEGAVLVSNETVGTKGGTCVVCLTVLVCTRLAHREVDIKKEPYGSYTSNTLLTIST